MQKQIAICNNDLSKCKSEYHILQKQHVDYLVNVTQNTGKNNKKMDLMIVDFQKQKTVIEKLRIINTTQCEIQESILRDIHTIGNGSTHTQVYEKILKRLNP